MNGLLKSQFLRVCFLYISNDHLQRSNGGCSVEKGRAFRKEVGVQSVTPSSQPGN